MSRGAEERELAALARESLELTDKTFGRHAGYRAAQAKGTLCHGMFVPTGLAAELTRAPHLQPGAQPTPVTARFSNASTNPLRRDGACDVRGIATAFHLPAGEQTDIIGLRMPRFFVGTAQQFVTWQRAMGRPLIDDLPRPRLLHIVGLLIRRKLPARFGIWQISSLVRVESYAGCRYNSLHAYKWVGHDGETHHVRYSWVPEEPERKLSWWKARRRDPDYLRADLLERLVRGPVRFKLEVQVAEPGDRTGDATVVWPASRRRIDVGTLELTAPGSSDAAAGAHVRFDPTRTTDGIELPEGDSLLRLRRLVYALSAARRAGVRTDGRRPAPSEYEDAFVPAPDGDGGPPSGDGARSGFFERDGVRIRYETSGTAHGRPLLLIMGFSCPMTWWDRDFRAKLDEKGFDVIRFDNRDCGRSSRIPVRVGRLRALLFPRRAAPYDVDDMGDDAAGLLEALGVPRAHVMGISLGGMIAQSLAVNHPERVASLTCVASTPVFRLWPPSRAPTFRVVRRMLKPPPPEKQRYVESALPLWRLLNGPNFPFEEEHVRELLEVSWEWSGGVDRDADERQMLAVRAARDRTPGLRGVQKPAEVIHGDADPLVRFGGGKATAKAIPGAHFVRVQGMGHYTPRETWDIVIDGIARAAARAERYDQAGAPVP